MRGGMKSAYIGLIPVTSDFTSTWRLSGLGRSRSLTTDQVEPGEVMITPFMVRCDVRSGDVYEREGKCFSGWEGVREYIIIFPFPSYMAETIRATGLIYTN
jgi:hypothetical protein